MTKTAEEKAREWESVESFCPHYKSLTEVIIKAHLEGQRVGHAAALEVAVEGWLSITPTGGNHSIALSKGTLIERIAGIAQERFSKYEEYKATQEAIINEMLKEGWQIRKVKIVVGE